MADFGALPALVSPDEFMTRASAGGAGRSSAGQVVAKLATAGLVTMAQLTTEQVRIAALETAQPLLTARVASLEGRDLEIGATVRSGNFNAALGLVEPVTTSAGNSVCLAPPTASLTDGVRFAVVLFGLPGIGFTCTIDFTTRSQTVHARAENIIITDEITPVVVQWSAPHSSWFIVS